ncbi:hypothetical protein [Mycobacterium tuberculosis]|uniref:hypothetical protein n=1 Tax=Mycobacterium tuberculosis TaxID=1773 RepID=UPI00272A6DD2|nr:hypothetical protein [Mycobacterium tuberculosis]
MCACASSSSRNAPATSTTVNCARLGYLHAGDETALYAALDRLLELGCQSLQRPASAGRNSKASSYSTIQPSARSAGTRSHTKRCCRATRRARGASGATGAANGQDASVVEPHGQSLVVVGTLAGGEIGPVLQDRHENGQEVHAAPVHLHAQRQVEPVAALLLHLGLPAAGIGGAELEGLVVLDDPALGTQRGHALAHEARIKDTRNLGQSLAHSRSKFDHLFEQFNQKGDFQSTNQP